MARRGWSDKAREAAAAARAASAKANAEGTPAAHVAAAVAHDLAARRHWNIWMRERPLPGETYKPHLLPARQERTAEAERSARYHEAQAASHRAVAGA